MGLLLPVLTRDVDCEPLGYPGIVLTLRLNVSEAEYQAQGEQQPWDRYGYFWVSRIVERVFVPAQYTDTGEDLAFELPDAKAAYDLMHQDDFDSNILTWAVEAWRQKRLEWLQADVKN